jgi:hypothetical protein
VIAGKGGEIYFVLFLVFGSYAFYTYQADDFGLEGVG